MDRGGDADGLEDHGLEVEFEIPGVISVAGFIWSAQDNSGAKGCWQNWATQALKKALDPSTLLDNVKQRSPERKRDD